MLNDDPQFIYNPAILELTSDLTTEQFQHLLTWLNAHCYTANKSAITKWREIYKHLTVWKRDPLIDFQTHLSHCNLDEYHRSCKYGDDNCPALTSEWSWIGDGLQRKDVVSANQIDDLVAQVIELQQLFRSAPK